MNLVVLFITSIMLFQIKAINNNLLEVIEKNYKEKEYTDLLQNLALLNITELSNYEIGIVHRIKGHLCLFGQEKDSNIDLSCAWKEYIQGASKGDYHSYFYVGFMMNNYLFDDITEIKKLVGNKMFNMNLTDFKTSDKNVVKEKIKAIASTCYYIAFLGDYLPAIVYHAYSNSFNKHALECNESAFYYEKVAEQLADSSQYFVYKGEQPQPYILTKCDPYNTENYVDKIGEMDPDYAIRTLSTIPLRIDKLGILVNITHYLFRSKKYTEAFDSYLKILPIAPQDPHINYYLAFMYLFGFGTPQNLPKALFHIKASYTQNPESINLLGILSAQLENITENSTSPLNDTLMFFTEAANNGSSYGALNTFVKRKQLFGINDTKAMGFLTMSSNKGLPAAHAILGIIEFLLKNKCESISHLKIATDYLISTNEFKDIYRYYQHKQKKLVTIYYMLLAELGNPVAQVNAGNLLDEYEFFDKKSWFSSIFPEENLDKSLAFKFYKMAESQGETIVYRRLADFYYFGFATEKNEALYYFYLVLGFDIKTPSSILAKISYDLGIICQFGLVPDFNCNYTNTAYNLGRLLHPSGYVPGTIMTWIKNWMNSEIIKNFIFTWKIIPCFLFIIWLIIPIIFIYKRR